MIAHNMILRIAMRLSVALIVIASSMLSACDLVDRFGSPEDRINAAVPPDTAVQVSRQLLLAQVADRPDARQTIEPQWTTRLRLRALSCSRDELPNWRQGLAEVRARFQGSDCLAEQDRLLGRWLGLQRLRLMLAQAPLGTVQSEPPPLVNHREPIRTMSTARHAPVAILQGANGFDIVDLGNGKSILHEGGRSASLVKMTLAPNGRVFAQTSGGNLSFRATEGGDTLLTLPDTDTVHWLPMDALLLHGPNDRQARLLDLASGDESLVPGQWSRFAVAVTPVPDDAQRFNMLWHRGVAQFEILSNGGRMEALLREEAQVTSNGGFSGSTGGISVDGLRWLDGFQGVRVVDLKTLVIDELDFGPIQSRGAMPLPGPQQFLLTLQLPAVVGMNAASSSYIYDHQASTLALISGGLGAGTRFQFLDAMQRLAAIESANVRILGPLKTEPAQPVRVVTAALIEELNQRRLSIAAAREPQGLAAERIANLQSSLERLRAGSPVRGAPSAPAAADRSAGGRPVLSLTKETQVEGVGVYEGQGAKHGYDKPRTAGAVEVRVRRSSKPIALVLSSYEPVQWVVVLEPGARLAAVLLSGYHESTVKGASTAPVYQIGRTYAYSMGGGGYAALQHEVVRWTGKPISAFQGRYDGSRFTVGQGP
ncbi:hypothetical protein [Rubrivivax albus]|uniref:Uncharacterized protein n=1 Tax=Rubrivivax albus TaxID=2499835 RepID=A0A3S2WUU0_9BURK|nr:hypothetical protein [Rubrivivax albus]RVT51544.1 hypothetical protein ENE75_12035 [Rubrivivax albus]